VNVGAYRHPQVAATARWGGAASNGQHLVIVGDALSLFLTTEEMFGLANDLIDIADEVSQ